MTARDSRLSDFASATSRLASGIIGCDLRREN